jgi:RNA polymerase sigma-70 factor (ECF subfamily)
MSSPVPPSSDTDQALLERAAAGDLEAFGAIYGRYRPVVYRFARAMTGTGDAADDITHDAFLAVLGEASRFDARRASLSTYLYGIVRNLCRAHLRRASRLQPMDGHADGWLAEAADLSDPLADAQVAALVRRALAGLPSRYRELILLCDLHELSYADAAQVVGASVPAVRSRLHRGRQLLKASLSPQLASFVPALRPARCAS